MKSYHEAKTSAPGIGAGRLEVRGTRFITGLFGTGVNGFSSPPDREEQVALKLAVELSKDFLNRGPWG